MIRRALGATRRDDGTAALEFAIVAPLLVMLLGGIVAFGMLFARYNEVNAIAAQAARDQAAGYSVAGTVDGVNISVSESYDAPWYGYSYDDDHDYWGHPGGWRVTITASDSFTFKIPFWSRFGGPSSLTIPLSAKMTQRVLRGWTDYHHDDHDGGWDSGGGSSWDSSGWGH